MKSILLDSAYNKETGVSFVKVRNKYGEFGATARLHPEDKDFESTFFGCQLAEAKCTIKTYQTRVNKINEHIKALENFEKTLKNLKDYNPHSIECCKLRKQIYLLKKEKCNLLQSIQNIKQNMVNSEQNRKATLEYFLKLKNELVNED